MKSKRISLTLEKIERTQSVQQGELKELPPEYQVTGMKNAVRIEWSKTLALTIGTRLNEQQADEIARAGSLDVTVTN